MVSHIYVNWGFPWKLKHESNLCESNEFLFLSCNIKYRMVCSYLNINITYMALWVSQDKSTAKIYNIQIPISCIWIYKLIKIILHHSIDAYLDFSVLTLISFIVLQIRGEILMLEFKKQNSKLNFRFKFILVAIPSVLIILHIIWN